jgi:hypothetical protein
MRFFSERNFGFSEVMIFEESILLNAIHSSDFNLLANKLIDAYQGMDLYDVDGAK